jgi:hypothetical protein
MNGGCVYPGLEGKAALTAFEGGIIQMQLQMERSFVGIAASTGKPSVVIFDRGLLDIPAYLPRESWLELIEARYLQPVSLRVMHGERHGF